MVAGRVRDPMVNPISAMARPLENFDLYKFSQFYINTLSYTLSGHTGSALVWHSEGRTIEALSVQ